jgi:hypothetical protein
MDLIEILAYIAIGVFLAFRVAMLAAFIALPVIVVRMIHRSAVVHRAPAAK